MPPDQTQTEVCATEQTIRLMNNLRLPAAPCLTVAPPRGQFPFGQSLQSLSVDQNQTWLMKSADKILAGWRFDSGLAADDFDLRGRRSAVPTTLPRKSRSRRKTVNLPAGKNLVGAFHQPRLVLIDTQALQTLPNGN